MKHIHALRLSGLTDSQIAAQSDISKAHLSLVARNKRKLAQPTHLKLRQLCLERAIVTARKSARCVGTEARLYEALAKHLKYLGENE